MSELLDSMNDSIKHVVDTVSIATVVGTLVNELPSIAALFSIIWTVIRIYETKTVQAWIKSDDEDDA